MAGLSGLRLAAAVTHATLGVSLAVVLWFGSTDLEGARERLLWGFPGPLLLIAPFVGVAVLNVRWRRYVSNADLGIAWAAGQALAQDGIREQLALRPASPLTPAHVVVLGLILVLSLLGVILLHRAPDGRAMAVNNI
jgi:hypothetical protein